MVQSPCIPPLCALTPPILLLRTLPTHILYRNILRSQISESSTNNSFLILSGLESPRIFFCNLKPSVFVYLVSRDDKYIFRWGWSCYEGVPGCLRCSRANAAIPNRVVIVVGSLRRSLKRRICPRKSSPHIIADAINFPTWDQISLGKSQRRKPPNRFLCLWNWLNT